MDIKEIGRGYVDWIHLSQDRHQWRAVVERGNEHSASIQCGIFRDQVSDCGFPKKDPYPIQDQSVVPFIL
jgi:hypothetical protein